MVYIITALYIEAQPFIKRMDLKRDVNISKFQVFRNENICLIITGVGKLTSAIATTYILSKFNINEDDLLINIGVCGCNNKEMELSSVFICNKIIDNDTGFTYYPDMIFNHGFNEAGIITSSKIVLGNISLGEMLVDMEAAGVYEAGSLFFQPHQMIFIKIVSDYLSNDSINKEDILNYIEINADKIVEFINKLNSFFKNQEDIFTKYEEEIINTLFEKLNLSVTMKNELLQFIKYYKLKDGDLIDLIKPYLDIECRYKKEGKIYFEKIKQTIIK